MSGKKVGNDLGNEDVYCRTLDNMSITVDFYSDLSHNLNNDLAVLKGVVEVLMNRSSCKNERQMLSTCLERVGDISSYIKDMKNYLKE